MKSFELLFFHDYMTQPLNVTLYHKTQDHDDLELFILYNELLNERHSL